MCNYFTLYKTSSISDNISEITICECIPIFVKTSVLKN